MHLSKAHKIFDDWKKNQGFKVSLNYIWKDIFSQQMIKYNCGYTFNGRLCKGIAQCFKGEKFKEA